MEWKSVLIGCILAITLGVILSLFVGSSGILIGFFIATIITGYLIGGDAVNGALSGVVVGLIAGVITALIILIAGGVFGGTLELIITSNLLLLVAFEIIGGIIIGATGGAIGSLIKGETNTHS